MSLHRVSRQEVGKASAILARSFHDDPLWVHVVPDAARRERLLPHAFEVSLRLGLAFGEVVATSPALEGISIWLPGENAAFSAWQVLRAGAFGAGIKIGLRRGQLLQRLTVQVEHHRRTKVPRPFMYLSVLGVATHCRGKGIGTRLLRAMLDETDAAGLPVYLETETESNLRFYERLGFSVMDRLTGPDSPVTFWGLLRTP